MEEIFQYGEGLKKQHKASLSIYLAIALLLAAVGFYYFWALNSAIKEISSNQQVLRNDINSIIKEIGTNQQVLRSDVNSIVQFLNQAVQQSKVETKP